MHTNKSVAIIGGGAAGLMAADILSQHFEVHIYEKGKAVGRKFLVAGNGGFNLTNSASGEELTQKYSPQDFLQSALDAFNSVVMRNWLADLGIPTFIGSSGRVFPEKGIKPITVLQKIKERLISNGVTFHFKHEFFGFSANQKPILKTPETEVIPEADHYIFALGGASWAVTGSDGSWLSKFSSFGVKTVPFQSSNCGLEVTWPLEFQEKYAGRPLKNIQLSASDFEMKGECLITEYGLEGNAIYPVVPKIREALNKEDATSLTIDFKPQNSLEQLLVKVKGQKIQSKNYEHFFKLSKAQLALIKLYTSKEEYLNPELLIAKIKSLEIPVTALRPIEEAISTVGGIALDEVNPDFTLKQFPHISVIGEMLDWDAPTGGFLLQGCFSTAHFAAQAILKKFR